MKTLNRIFTGMALSGLLLSCTSKKITEPVSDTTNTYELKIKGSDTEYEMVKNLCSDFDTSDTLRYTIEGGGTELGIKALIYGKVNMATASREINELEMKQLRNNNISVLPIMFATDAIAIITHPKLGVDSLTLEQLSKLFKGEITNWKEVGGPDRKVTVYSRNSNSGTYFYFKDKVTHGEFPQSAIVCQNTKHIVDMVSKDSTGIGYVSAGFIMNGEGKPSNKIWAMPLSIDNKHCSISPYQVEEVKVGNYPLTRPLYQYFSLPMNPKAKDFVMFELAQKGQQLIRKFGYFPITDYQREINKLKGLNL